jgi:hypothetical protein
MSSIEIHGTLRENGVVILDQQPNLPPGRVRLTIAPIIANEPQTQPQTPPELPQWAKDMARFRRNREQFPDEQLEPFWGMQVAWNMEGTQIIASAATDRELYAILKQSGIDSSEVVFDFIPDPFVSYIG